MKHLFFVVSRKQFILGTFRVENVCRNNKWLFFCVAKAVDFGNIWSWKCVSPKPVILIFLCRENSWFLEHLELKMCVTKTSVTCFDDTHLLSRIFGVENVCRRNRCSLFWRFVLVTQKYNGYTRIIYILTHHTHVFICNRRCVCVYVHTRTQTRTHTQTHIHTHTHTHTCIMSNSSTLATCNVCVFEYVFMCVCMCVCEYVCMYGYVYISVRVYVRIYTYIQMYTYVWAVVWQRSPSAMYVYVCVFMCVYVCVCEYVCMYIYIYVYKCVRVYVCVYVFIQIYIRL